MVVLRQSDALTAVVARARIPSTEPKPLGDWTCIEFCGCEEQLPLMGSETIPLGQAASGAAGADGPVRAMATGAARVAKVKTTGDQDAPGI